MDLERYRAAAIGEESPAYAETHRSTLGNIDLSALSEDELWAIHKKPQVRSGLCHPELLPTDSSHSLLDLKIELADRMLKHCCLCELRCGANRYNGEQGLCGVGLDSRVFFEQILWAEEAPVIPSHEVFFSGCNMRCTFCYSSEAVMDPSHGKVVSPDDLALLFDSRRREGAANVNLIGGEPTVHLPNILKALRLAESPTAVVWNSNFYMSEETMRLLDGVVDLYLGDFKFGNDACAGAVARTGGYLEVIARNIMQAAESADIIIRHLVLPGHIECCLRPVAEWVAANLPEAPFNLMFQYTPFHRALGDRVLGRCLTPEEEEQARTVVESYGLNIKRWNRPLELETTENAAGRGAVEATITIGPDGRVSITRLHRELLDLARALQNEGDRDGGSG